MRNVRTKGSMLPLAVAITVVLFIVGATFFILAQLLGGVRELQHATDAGNLNVAKQSMRKPSVALNPGIEVNNFAGLVDTNGNIDLLDYNRLFAQALIVALNAQDEDTDQAKQNAQTVLAALQDNNSVGKRLSDALSRADSQTGHFTNLARANTTRMLTSSSRISQADEAYQVAYLYPGEPTNVYLDPTILPAGVTLPQGLLSQRQASNGLNYMAGYRDLVIDSLNGKKISGVPVRPDYEPHLVSQAAFNHSLNSPVSNRGVPPNTFRSSGKVLDARVNTFLNSTSCATVGALNQTYTACIPRGYLCFTNLPGLPDDSPVPSNESIFNNQLYSGIFLANNGAFSTDQELMLKWVDYNNDPNSESQPSSVGIYGADPHGITSLGGGPNAYPPEVDYTMMSGAGEIPQVAALLQEFEQAYPAANGQGGQTLVLTAVEKLKALVMAQFASGQPGNVEAPQEATGLRLFDQAAQYPMPDGASPRFTRSGTVPQLLAQVGNGADTLFWNQIVQRIREIKPDANLTEINTLFAGNLLEMGETLYLYQLNDRLTMTRTPPPWLVAGTTPDGNPQDRFSTYQTIGFSVNPPGEGGLRNVMFEETPNPTTHGIGKDEAILTLSSGFNNLLAAVEFRESVGDVPLVTNSPPDCDCPCLLDRARDAVNRLPMSVRNIMLSLRMHGGYGHNAQYYSNWTTLEPRFPTNPDALAAIRALQAIDDAGCQPEGPPTLNMPPTWYMLN